MSEWLEKIIADLGVADPELALLCRIELRLRELDEHDPGMANVVRCDILAGRFHPERPEDRLRALSRLDVLLRDLLVRRQPRAQDAPAGSTM